MTAQSSNAPAGDEAEGRYTEVNGQEPSPHGVHGRYTAEDTDTMPQSDAEGGYTNTETDPEAHERDGLHGHYTDSDD
ncbi:hypothetical protein OSC27_01545 [Microbacterium sp. STN6]|uniref:hypothetical protein n=1 Tax=Microbacterium sp. STN6 TaxID=2995588 RepID=UPI002260DD17|nr:hypothetical protein [Microbacterium sp. STN6]MCX7520954.1 hypothetical protein [Microbacterium sp. STN6]